MEIVYDFTATRTPDEIRELIEKNENFHYILDAIYLWKLDRGVDYSNIGGENYNPEELKKELNKLSSLKTKEDILANKDKIKKLVRLLVDTKEVRLAVASTVLHFYNELLPIFDTRAYRQVYRYEVSFKSIDLKNLKVPDGMGEYKDRHGIEVDKPFYENEGQARAMLYLDYTEKCYKLVDGKFKNCKLHMKSSGETVDVTYKNIDKYLYAIDKKEFNL